METWLQQNHSNCVPLERFLNLSKMEMEVVALCDSCKDAMMYMRCLAYNWD